MDGILNGQSIQTLLRGENDSKQSDEIQATLVTPWANNKSAAFPKKGGIAPVPWSGIRTLMAPFTISLCKLLFGNPGLGSSGICRF